MIWIYYAWKYVWSLRGIYVHERFIRHNIFVALSLTLELLKSQEKVFYVWKIYEGMFKEIRGIFFNLRAAKAFWSSMLELFSKIFCALINEFGCCLLYNMTNVVNTFLKIIKLNNRITNMKWLKILKIWVSVYM